MIISKLSLLAKYKTTINVTTSNDGEASATTTIVGIDDKKNAIFLSYMAVINENESGQAILDFDASDNFNKSVIKASYIEFTTVFHDIEVEFSSKSIKNTTYEDTNVLMVAIPPLLNWQNRREYDRNKISPDASNFCEIILKAPVPNESSVEYREKYREATDHIERILLKERKVLFEKTGIKTTGDMYADVMSLSMHDVSLAGCSFVNVDKEFSYFLKPGTIHKNCKIMMANGSEINVTLEVMTNRASDTKKEAFSELVGVRFIKVHREAVENNDERAMTH
jgi:hypothetical protein